MAPSRADVIPDQATNAPLGLKLIPNERLDQRPDKVIMEELLAKRLIASEKNIWAYWHTGFEEAPAWLKRNVISWARRHGAEWTIHVLDDVPGSEMNVRNYIEPELLSEAFNKDVIDGQYKATHASDLIRLPLLWKYGGVWMDLGTILFRHLNDICWRAIEDPNSPSEVAGLVIAGLTLNGFIASKRGNIFLKHWHNTYLKLWEGGVTNSDDFHKHPIFHNVKLRQTGTPNLTPEQFTDYVAHSQCVLATLEIVDADFNGQEYFSTRFLLTDAFEEMYRFQFLTEWSGQKAFDLLSMKRDGADAIRDESWKRADDLVHSVLINSSMLKLSHGAKGLFESTLAGFWDMKEHADADVEPHTFAKYLREASVKYDQTRKVVPMSSEAIVTEIVKQMFKEPWASKS